MRETNRMFRRVLAVAAVLGMLTSACSGSEEAGSDGTPTDEADGNSASVTTDDNGTDETAAEALSLTLGIQGNFPPHNLSLLAESLGYYEDVGLDVEIVDVRASTDAAAGVIGGSIDIAVVAPDAWIPTINGEADIVGIASTNRATIWDIVSTQDVAGWEDFAGRRVALPNESGMSTIAFILGLRDVGLQLSDVEPVYAGGTGDRYAALQSGTVEVATLGVPVSYVAESEGFVNHGPAADEVVEMTSVNVIASRGWLEGEGEEAALRWLEAMVTISDWAQDPANLDELTTATAESMDIEEEFARRGWEEVFSNNIISPDLTYEPSGVDNVLQVFVDQGVIDEMPDDPSTLYDHSWLERARERVDS